MSENKKHDIVPAHLAVQAMRDNGYKNAAYALAELMDNSIQAKARMVELLCGERVVQLDQRRRQRIEQIAVLDNGKGMDEKVLRMALQFGNGTYLDEDKHTGIGRFGMGLPSSSVSQCERVDVWTWQNGVDSAIYSYLDLREIRGRKLTEVPEPKPKKVPPLWRQVGSSFGKTGTLVVWSQIDRIMWKTAGAIIDNSEFLIGRMYRKFLEDDKVRIRMVSFDIDDIKGSLSEQYAQPNDPCYLMDKTSCPAPFDTTPMFQPWGDEDYERKIAVSFRGKKHEVNVRFSYAKEDARRTPSGRNPGDLPHGKHAARNVGVSLVRAGRELELDQSWVIKYDPVERWWGVEVEFPPSLDDLFGVTNNKQAARNFSELAKLDIEYLLKGGRTIVQVMTEMQEDEDPRGPLVEIANVINNQLSVIRGLLKAQTKGVRGPRRHEDVPPAEVVATEATKDRQEEGYVGASDKDETLPPDERKGIIEETLVDEGVTQDQAQELAAKTISDGLKYVFATAPLETSAFFSVKPRGGAIVITLNTSHPAYNNLVELLDEEVEGADTDTLRTRLVKSAEGLKLLLTAWARYEDEQPDGIRKTRAQEARSDWGRIARQFYEVEEQ
jgi:histidine kinase/DNA gyrase B/HSP90-like ATPase